jgi:hypothetical protein
MRTAAAMCGLLFFIVVTIIVTLRWLLRPRPAVRLHIVTSAPGVTDAETWMVVSGYGENTRSKSIDLDEWKPERTYWDE